MNVYDQAHQLAQSMRQSEEYLEYMRLKETAYEDSTNRALLDEYKKLQYQMQVKMASGERMEEDDLQRMQKIAGILQFNPDASAYLMAEFRFQKMLADIYKILADAAGINLDMLGRHTVGTGSAPQAVISSLVTNPLDKHGLKITDIDKYSPEMQNPDITKPAGAGDVPLANYKMIAALAVKRGELQRADLASFPAQYGLTGWAPTQGHIPSGVPYIGFAREDIMAGKLNRVMIIGKGSLFLGRMTNLFDGVSFVIQANTGAEETSGGVSEDEVKGMIAKAMRDFAATLMAQAE